MSKFENWLRKKYTKHANKINIIKDWLKKKRLFDLESSKQIIGLASERLGEKKICNIPTGGAGDYGRHTYIQPDTQTHKHTHTRTHKQTNKHSHST